MLISGGLGAASTWGNMIIYITSFERSYSINEHLTANISACVYPLTLIVAGISMPLGQKLYEQYNTKLVLFLGSMFIVLDLYLISKIQ
jgi:hypothetical protein